MNNFRRSWWKIHIQRPSSPRPVSPLTAWMAWLLKNGEPPFRLSFTIGMLTTDTHTVPRLSSYVMSNCSYPLPAIFIYYIYFWLSINMEDKSGPDVTIHQTIYHQAFELDCWWPFVRLLIGHHPHLVAYSSLGNRINECEPYLKLRPMSCLIISLFLLKHSLFTSAFVRITTPGCLPLVD